ncbi:hypothetical protein B8V81_0643 [Paenibacillus pasadenensis]|uniref:Uncharacterized protein n=1 Tax=Paenibacillus pasadenensis TaxID=217090 RepID=A0A2N5NBK7_9BACL|nr:hypothetical protein B8V81_0643 [Paenibacillus pasadenensis]
MGLFHRRSLPPCRSARRQDSHGIRIPRHALALACRCRLFRFQCSLPAAG